MAECIPDSPEHKPRYILCIDDEQTILEALYTQLTEWFKGRYEIECAEGGEEALEVFDEIYDEEGRIDLVLCDQLMPDLLGQYVLEQIHQRDPRVMKVLLTGQAGLDAVTYAINHAGLHKYIEKPWDKHDLLLTVENLLAQYTLSGELEVSRRRYEMILRSMNNGVISLDAQGKITSFNQAAAKILGIDHREILQKPYDDVFLPHAQNADMHDAVAQAIQHWTATMYKEVRFSRCDGTIVPLGLMTSILKDVDNSELGVLIVLHDLSEMQKYTALKSMFSRYVAEQVVEKISTSEEFTLEGEKREVTILFSDIRGFTSLAEQLEPTDVVATLNAYFSCMIDVIYEYEGTVDKFLGDGIMCIFGAPIDQPAHAARAARAALAMQHTLAGFNQCQLEVGRTPLKMGIGINTGEAVIGNVGSEKRLEYTAIGDNVNLAARLQAIAKGGQILITETTYAAIRHLATVNTLSPVKLKGKLHDIPVHELVAIADESEED
ncbi:response regulator [candidate division KSB3 bacterium]|uniref:Response regulator n=1 Tax=candidate division KSB3 bacterium TaxID=2044937 RepID=A0A9D5Q612_9BACT|nr:response regulator [candidate division KSB3 bacterium]MBD3325379.1 response regulator [candidate division KSB3 bacterium]